MKKPAASCLIAVVLGANFGCEQQSYEETKIFNQSAHATPHAEKHEAGKAASADHDAGKPEEKR